MEGCKIWELGKQIRPVDLREEWIVNSYLGHKIKVWGRLTTLWIVTGPLCGDILPFFPMSSQVTFGEHSISLFMSSNSPYASSSILLTVWRLSALKNDRSRPCPVRRTPFIVSIGRGLVESKGQDIIAHASSLLLFNSRRRGNDPGRSTRFVTFERGPTSRWRTSIFVWAAKNVVAASIPSKVHERCVRFSERKQGQRPNRNRSSAKGFAIPGEPE